MNDAADRQPDVDTRTNVRVALWVMFGLGLVGGAGAVLILSGADLATVKSWIGADQ